MMVSKGSFPNRFWNNSLDLPLHLRRGLSGIFIMHRFPCEDRNKPTAIEDCPDYVVRHWLYCQKEDEEMARNTLAHLIECYDKLFTHLYDNEKEMVNKAIEKRADKPEITEESLHFEVVNAVVWYCQIIVLTADMFGICKPDTEAELAYNERTERRKSKDNE